MKSTICAMCVAVACSAAAVMAQSTTTMDKGTMKDQGKMAQKGMTMVTGCVADKDSSGHYMLNNAMMSSGMKDMKDMSMPSSTAGSAPMMSYQLSGGDLKAHVGHKVEITGTMAAAKMDKMSKKDDKMAGTAGTPGMSPMDHDKMMSSVLKVKSVKMISDSCQ